MRDSLLELIHNTIIYKYSLPNESLKIPKSTHSTQQDECYESLSDSQLSEIIYNLILEYSFNDYELTQTTYENLLVNALQTKLKYDKNYDVSQKLKLGFFGEVLLYGILSTKFSAQPIISRGYFYSPAEHAETKGYDCYHLIENDNKIELWFGETKFMQSFPECIDSVFENINKALSTEYLCNRNIIPIIGQKDRITNKKSKLFNIIDDWWKNGLIDSLEKEITKYNIELVYPVFLTSQKLKTYEKTIEHAIEKINKKTISKNLSIPCSIFFIFLPVNNTNDVKRSVIQWIESKKPLLS